MRFWKILSEAYTKGIYIKLSLNLSEDLGIAKIANLIKGWWEKCLK